MTEGKDTRPPSGDAPGTDAPRSDAPAAKPRPRRAPKFTLPDHHHEEAAGPALVGFLESAPTARRARKFTLPEGSLQGSTGDRIEAFIDGSPTRRRRATARKGGRRRIPDLEPGQVWAAGVRQEAARQARYGRPMAILLLSVETGVLASDAADHRLIEIVGREVRETDRVSRPAIGRMSILLPETSEDEAIHVAGRIERGFRLLGDDAGTRGEIHVEIAIPHRGTDPMEAVAEAERRLAEAAAFALRSTSA